MEKMTAMRAGGAKLHQIKLQLQEFSTVGRKLADIDALAHKLLLDAGAKPNFNLVPGYKWVCCINRNAGIVHGIPDDSLIENGDLISIDLGLIWEGWNLDTSISFIAGDSTPTKDHFLAVGQKALRKAISEVSPGNSVYDVSRQIEKTVRKAGFDPTYQLTGHFIGRQLHESPMIPCFAQKSDRRKILKVGDALAIEVMYAMGECDLQLAADGWTYETIDGSLTALFEDTVLVTEDGPEVVT